MVYMAYKHTITYHNTCEVLGELPDFADSFIPAAIDEEISLSMFQISYWMATNIVYYKLG